jgi:hypothetical protein
VVDICVCRGMCVCAYEYVCACVCMFARVNALEKCACVCAGGGVSGELCGRGAFERDN